MEKELTLFEKIKEANSKMPTIKLQGKPYVQVKDRIVGFRSIYPNGTIDTDIQFQEHYVLCTAMVFSGEMRLLSKAHARVLLSKDKAVEKCESTAIGRSLAFLGLGTSDSIASFEEMEEMEEGTGAFDEDIEIKNQLVEKFNKLDVQKKADVLNMFRVKSAEELKVETLKDIVNG